MTDNRTEFWSWKICYVADEMGEQRRDELLAWLDKLTAKRRLLEES
jgi:hypothetical protein